VPCVNDMSPDEALRRFPAGGAATRLNKCGYSHPARPGSGSTVLGRHIFLRCGGRAGTAAWQRKPFDEPAIDSTDLLAGRLLEGLVSHLDRPFALFGHSMGAIAFELARNLRTKGLEPVHVFASG
jgi:hypothetical protein